MDMFKPTKKTIIGRKKIEIKKLDKNSCKLVTFSKRRAGLFRKASELCILCHVYAAIIVFSPADKLFCFGEPNTENIVARYLKETAAIDAPTKDRREGGKPVSYEEHNKEYDEAMKKLELERKELADMKTLAKHNNKRGDWWKESINEMSVEQLEQFMIAIYELRGKLVERAVQLRMQWRLS
ncbi:hypothetical protein RIF29_22778 [Crotalaria pallida]|uniref:MADS-box domain-containing protein n=1 Tax=Crotalaria pallida TaxID=3830 RepID=A0AAN9F9B0_CROPI